MSMQARVAVLVLFVALPLLGRGLADPSAADKESDGWKDLFDGKSLTGWKSADFYAPGKVEGKKIAGNDFFCTTTFPVGDSFCSLVVGGWSGTVVGLSSIDSMDASMNETRKDMEFKADQWYRVRIRVSQKRIEAWIDRDKLVDLDTTDRRISIRLECNACKPFGIATYQTTGAVRNIRVRQLTEADKKAIAAKAEKKD
jgi:hypothetical protein